MSPVVHNKINPHERSKKNELDLPSTVVIASEDGQEMLGVCDGPDKHGQCPFAGVDGHLPCNGDLIVIRGWALRVAEDATSCPVAVLGLAPTDAE